MENRLNLLGSKKIKWAIISTLLVLCMALGLTIWGVVRNLNSYLTFNVEFVKGINDVLVQTYQKGEKLNFPDTPTKAGYSFVGWSLDKNLNSLVSTDLVVDKELTLYAKWQEKQYNLTYDQTIYHIDHSSNISLNGNSVCFNSDGKFTTLTPPELENKEFDKWIITDGTNTFTLDNFSLNSVNGLNLTLQAIYKDVFVSYNIYGDFSNATLNTDLTGKIALGNKLEFEITLSDSVSDSELKIETSSGVVSYTQTENVYKIKIENFSTNLNVYVNNITINSYLINYNINGETTTLTQTHGSCLTPPVLTNDGHTLLGFTDQNQNFISLNHIVTKSLTLTPVWQIETYLVEFPKSNGCYVISYETEHITNGKTAQISYNSNLQFEITLSRAYSNSEIKVFAEADGKIIYPTKTKNTYSFNNVKTNLTLRVENVKVNTYELIVDDKNYGCFSYGSWISVEDNSLVVTENISRSVTNISALVAGDQFGGWILNGMEVLTNSFIQDIENKQVVEISGQYTKNATRIQFVLNGGQSNLTELIVVENQEYTLPIPTKTGYTFVGWFTTLVEVNTQVNQELSEPFTEITGRYLVLYAGWKIAN